MALSFSVATPEHIEHLCGLVNLAYRGEFSKLGWTTEADLLSGQRIDSRMMSELILTSPDQIILMASDPDHRDPVACVQLKKISDQVCYFGMLTVKPGLQNKGTGRQVLSEAESWARSWGCTEMTLSIIQVRRELIDWYTRRGYNLTGGREDFPYGNEHFGIPQRGDLYFLTMTKSL